MYQPSFLKIFVLRGNQVKKKGVYVFVDAFKKNESTLKIIQLHKDTDELIAAAIKNKRAAQQALFEKYAPKMLGVCRQYVKDVQHAEELMLAGFLKVFTHIATFQKTGSFEGWIRRIMVNTCISFLRKKHPEQLTDEDFVFDGQATQSLERTGLEDVQRMIDALPVRYKMVFNLYAVEGYKHAEIAKELGISENTSKSQLFKARKWLQNEYIKLNKVAYEVT